MGRTFSVDATLPSRALLGQGPSCEFRLQDKEVSRRHAAVEVVGQRLHLVDLGSTNGTFVNGLGVEDAFLLGQEIIRIGRTALRVDVRSGASIPEPNQDTTFGKVVGSSPEMRRLYQLCARMAGSEVPVVIEGETGTGKEVLAEALHDQGPRAQGPFVVFDCTAVPANLLESELFGHERGAFTGAVSSRKGVFEQAQGGTLLIDEIGDLELSLQPKLLRVIERSEVRRVGGERPIRVDVRILAATRRDLDRAVLAGRFRDDLFHRLAVGRIELPPLRRRQGDIAVLARHFCRQLGAGRNQLPDDLLVRWEDYPWPGNVRELRNAVARYLALGDCVNVSRTTTSAQRPEPGLAPESDRDSIERILALGLSLPVARQKLQ